MRHPSPLAAPLLTAADALSNALAGLTFGAPVTHVYNPYVYARAGHQAYLERWAPQPDACRAVFLGMNPGPWGMAQTGVPFGEVAAVRDWLQLAFTVEQPPTSHPKRPVLGMQCPRSEVSGRRLWGLFAQLFTEPDTFFAHHLVLNYCPLAFMAASGANITPDKLPAAERDALQQLCDNHLATCLRILRPATIIGVGGFAAKCAERVTQQSGLPAAIHQMLHPSPASPAANRDWPALPTRQLRDFGVVP
jgi:single-strand selective monofunctional uracil DNA glycosylase